MPIIFKTAQHSVSITMDSDERSRIVKTHRRSVDDGRYPHDYSDRDWRELSDGEMEQAYEREQQGRLQAIRKAKLKRQRKSQYAPHIYFDPFSVHYTPLYSIVADLFSAKVRLYTGTMTAVFSPFFVLDVVLYVGILRLVWSTFVFDPGGFEDESFRRERV